MNGFYKILFWTFTILLGFVNPLISITMVVLYYLPKIIRDIIQPCDEQPISGMKSFSDDILEENK